MLDGGKTQFTVSFLIFIWKAIGAPPRRGLEMEHSGIAPHIIALTTMLFIAGLVHATTRWLRAPYTIGLLVAGLALGVGSEALPFSLKVAQLRLTPDLIFYIILPVLVFEAGIGMDPRYLRQELGSILSLAIPGFLCSSLVICGLLGLITPLSYSYALLFGVLISATDPVAVIALLKEQRAPKRVSVLMDGESLFNDATAIVAFGLLLEVLRAASGSSGASTGFGALSGFLFTFFGGLAVGTAIGAVAAEVLRIEQGNEAVEVTLSVVTALSAFFIAEHCLGVSGVLSVLMAAITFRSRGRTVITDPSHRHAMRFFWEYAAFLVNSVVFLLLGLTQRQLLVNITNYDRPWLLLGGTIVAVLVGRVVAVHGVLPFSALLLRSETVNSRTRWAMVWGGLRGAVPMALVLSLPEDLPYRQGLFDMTLTVILFTLLIQGSTIGWVMARLGLTGAVSEPPERQ